MENKKAKGKKKVLIAEDEAVLSQMYKDKLEMNDFAVIQAFDGEEAIKLALSEKPDIILLDILMPKKHGLDVLAALQKDAWGKKVRVIILTNIPEYPSLANFSQQWSYIVMSKADYTPDQVLENVKKLTI